MNKQNLSNQNDKTITPPGSNTPITIPKEPEKSVGDTQSEVPRIGDFRISLEDLKPITIQKKD